MDALTYHNRGRGRGRPKGTPDNRGTKTPDNRGAKQIKRRLDYSLRSYLPLSTEKRHMTCPEHSLFSFNRIFMRLADNLDRHKSRTRSILGQVGLLTLE